MAEKEVDHEMEAQFQGRLDQIDRILRMPGKAPSTKFYMVEELMDTYWSRFITLKDVRCFTSDRGGATVEQKDTSRSSQNQVAPSPSPSQKPLEVSPVSPLAVIEANRQAALATVTRKGDDHARKRWTVG